MENKGHISQIIGPVIDVLYKNGELPDIRNALHLKRDDGNDLVLEVAQHLGENSARCIAMDSTDGLKRGHDVFDTGEPISVTGNAWPHDEHYRRSD